MQTRANIIRSASKSRRIIFALVFAYSLCLSLIIFLIFNTPAGNFTEPAAGFSVSHPQDTLHVTINP